MIKDNFIHPTAIVDPGAELKEGAKVWHFAHVRAGAILGKEVSVGKDCYIDSQVQIGDYSRIQNGVSVYNGIHISEWIFIGPHVVFTNDLFPRAGSKQWELSETYLNVGCSIGAGAIIRCGVKIGAFSLIAAGSLVTKDIPPFTLVMGSPSKEKNRICACGKTSMDKKRSKAEYIQNCCIESLDPRMIKLAEKSLLELNES